MRLNIDILHRQGDFVLDAKLLLTESATGIFGHSGSGKSTLLRCIAGLIKPSVGLIELDGETLFDSDRRIWVPPHKRRIGVVFQEPRLFPHWTVRKNLNGGKRPRSNTPPLLRKAGGGPAANRTVAQPLDPRAFRRGKTACFARPQLARLSPLDPDGRATLSARLAAEGPHPSLPRPHPPRTRCADVDG